MNKKVYVCKECDVEEIIIGKKKGRIFHRGTGKDPPAPRKEVKAFLGGEDGS